MVATQKDRRLWLGEYGDRRVRRELRQTLKQCGLPIKGPLYDHAYAYIRENY